MENNVCLFVPKTNVYETIHPVNFVLERKVQLKKEFTTPFHLGRETYGLM
jgi:hypothetical protein